LQTNEDAVQTLVELGANITIRNKKEFSAQGLAKRHLEELSGKESRPRGRFGKKKRPATFEKPPTPDATTEEAPIEEEPTQPLEVATENDWSASGADTDWAASSTNNGWDAAPSSEWDTKPRPDEGGGNWGTEEPETKIDEPSRDIWGNVYDVSNPKPIEEIQVVEDIHNDVHEEDDGDDEENQEAVEEYPRLQPNWASSTPEFDIFGTAIPAPLPLHDYPTDDYDEYVSSLSSSESDLDRPEKERRIRRAEKRARKLAQKDADRQARIEREKAKEKKTTKKSSAPQSSPRTKEERSGQEQQPEEDDPYLGSIFEDSDDDGYDLFGTASSSLTASTNTGVDPSSLIASEDSLFRSATVPVPAREPVVETPITIALRILRWLRHHAKETGKMQQQLFDNIKSSGSASDVAPHIEPFLINAVLPQRNESPLLCAVKYSPADVVEYLIGELGANPKIANLVNESLLHHAIKRGDSRIVSILLAAGVNLFARNSRGDTPLETALQSSMGANWEIVSALLEATLERPAVAEVQKLSQSICWCLREAVKRGSMDTVRLILASGVASVASASTGAGWTPIHLAVKFGHLEIAELLIKSTDKQAINAQTSDGFSALHMAIEKAKDEGEDQMKMIHLLLNNGADPNAKIKSGISALHMSTRHGFLDCSAALLRAGANPNAWNDRLRTPLWLAFKDSRSSLCQVLVKHGATDLNGKITYLTGEPLIYESVRRADSDLVRAMLIDQHWDFDPLWKHPKTGMTLANLAVMKELDADVVSVIGKKYLDITKPKQAETSNEQQSYSVYSFQEPVVEEKKAPEEATLNIPGRGPLHTAVLIGSEPMVDVLCSLGFDCNKEDTKGISPISLSLIHQKTSLLRMMAAKYGGLLSFAPVERSRRKPSTQILVELGMEQKDLLQIYLDQKPAEAGSALWFAIEQNRLEMARWLLHERGTDPNPAVGDLKRTILHRVVQKGDIEATRLLLSCRDIPSACAVNVNCQDKHGWTPLHIAIQKNHVDICQMILEDPSVDVSLEDERKFTVLHLALAVPHMTEVVQKILSLRRNEMRVDLDNDYGKNPLFYAMRRRQWEIASKLLSMSGTLSLSNQAPKVGTSGWSLMHIAAVNGFADIIHELGRGADWRTVNALEGRGWTPLHLAVRHLHVESVEALLRYGASVSVQTHKLWNPLHTLAATAHFDELKTASPENYEKAVRILDLLLTSQDSYVAAMAPNETKNTPLDVAISFENVTFAKILLDRGITRSRSFDLVEFKGLPLHKAVSRGSVATLEIVLHKMKQLPVERRRELMNETRGRSEWPALFTAVQEWWSKPGLVTVLLQNGADAFFRDANNQNILHIVGHRRSTDAARAIRKEVPEKALVKLMGKRDSQGFTPMDVAGGRYIKRFFRNGILHTHRTSAKERYLNKPDKKSARKKKVENRRIWKREMAFEKEDYLAHRPRTW
jgi:ankyrin repeat protein